MYIKIARKIDRWIYKLDIQIERQIDRKKIYIKIARKIDRWMYKLDIWIDRQMNRQIDL